MEGLPEELDIDMIVFDVDGTLLDFRGFHPELIPLIRRSKSVESLCPSPQAGHCLISLQLDRLWGYPGLL